MLRREVSANQAASGELMIVGLLLVASGVVLCKDITVGGFRYGDAAVHAMDGVLIHDWIASGPEAWAHPLDFASRQYAHYPSLGIGRHYPPGFAIVEAAFFAVLGISVFSARLCVVFFGLAAVCGTYVLVRRCAGRFASAFAATAFIAMPATTEWGRQVVLEVPTLAVLIWASVAFSWYLSRPTAWRLCLVIVLSGTAILFKQPAVFFVVALGITFVIGACSGRIRKSHCAVVVAVAGAMAVLALVSLDGHGSQLWRGDASFPVRWSLPAVSYYLTTIPDQVGLVVLAAFPVGLVAFHRKMGLLTVLLALWTAVCYAMLSSADYKLARFLYLGLFPFAVWAGLGAETVLSLLPRIRSRVVVGSCVCAVCFGYSLSGSIEYRPDYGPIVAVHRSRILGHAVLFSGLRDGDFVFAVRQHLPWRQAVVIRGSKLLYTCNGRPDLDFVSKVDTPAALEELMRRFAFRYVFAERENKLGLVEDRLLRDFLARGDVYRRIGSLRYEIGSEPCSRDTTLDIYEAVHPLAREVGHFDIPIPRTHSRVRVDLSRWS